MSDTQKAVLAEQSEIQELFTVLQGNGLEKEYKEAGSVSG